jgi:hypothetical protein
MPVQVLQRMCSAKRGKSLAALAIALSLGGCSKSDGDPAVPVACKEGADAVRAALARAPARVELDGTPLSECFAPASNAADLQLIGASYVTAAARLADTARQRPEGPEALRLGYLVAAVERGSGRTQGVHEELYRRIVQELNGVNISADAYRRGHRAGKEHG